MYLGCRREPREGVPHVRHAGIPRGALGARHPEVLDVQHDFLTRARFFEEQVRIGVEILTGCLHSECVIFVARVETDGTVFGVRGTIDCEVYYIAIDV